MTDDQIKHAEVLFASKHSQKKVLKVNSTTVVKLGPDLEMTEVDNLTFIRSWTTIPVPRILNAYEKEGCKYIAMEYLDGDNLESVWPDLPNEHRKSICSELRDYLNQMRNISAPTAFIGSVSGGPAVDRRSLGSVKGVRLPARRSLTSGNLISYVTILRFSTKKCTQLCTEQTIGLCSVTETLHFTTYWFVTATSPLFWTGNMLVGFLSIGIFANPSSS